MKNRKGESNDLLCGFFYDFTNSPSICFIKSRVVEIHYYL